VKESCIQDLDNKSLLSLHSHEHYMAFILIYIPIRLYLENEEEIEVTEEKTPPPSDSQAGIVYTSISAGPSLTHLLTKASPGAFATSLDVFKIFLTCLLH
jgi:hypothetical protein